MRVSTNRQEPENQTEAIERYCQTRGIEIVERFIDRRSGLDDDRPEFQRMLREAEGSLPRFSRIVCWSIDRFSRMPPLKTLQLLEDLRANGVFFVSVTEPLFQMDGPFMEIPRFLLAWFAQYESEQKSIRIKAGQERARREGKEIGRPRRELDAAQIIAAIAQGKTYDQIARELSTPDHPVSASTVYRRAKNWRRTTTTTNVLKAIKEPE